MKRISKKQKWGPMLFVLLLLCLVAIVTADPYVGGIPLDTIQSGTVSGGVYMDADNNWWPVSPGPMDVEKEFASIPDVSDIEWARLYVMVYCGHMQNNYQGTATISFDGDGDGTYETAFGTESLNVNYTYPDPVIINDHMNRVTSDYLMWYDVTDDISSQTPAAHVVTSALDGYFDGRIALITLIVAYNDGDSDEVYYWVNQGHDTDTYLYSGDYVGETYFDLFSLSGTVESATLMVNHKASVDGDYSWFGCPIPTDPDGSTVPPGSDRQGSYFGWNVWDLTNYVEFDEEYDLTYDRNDQFYKIPLAILVVEKEPELTVPVAAFSAEPRSGETPLTVDFTDLSTGPPTSWIWYYRLGSASWIQFSTDQDPSYTFTEVGNYRIRLTATNAMGSDTETSSSSYIIIDPASGCDLNVTAITPIANTVFARETNTVSVTVTNLAAGSSEATTVSLVG
ncbi:MAG: DUF3344 domain-containing protein, partial [Methanoregulaceae archaeon]|nr:DUF3344 domain-containing protein [Methanoregulaceae archaeon]